MASHLSDDQINRAIIRGFTIKLREELTEEFRLAAQPIIDATVNRLIERFEIVAQRELDVVTLDRNIKLEVLFHKEEEAKDA